MPDPDLRALLESWIIHLRAERKAEGTVRLYATGVRAFLAWGDRQGRPATLDRPTVAAFIAELLYDGREAATARARQLALRRFAAWLAEEGELDADPLAGLKPPKLDSKVVPVLGPAARRRAGRLPGTGADTGTSPSHCWRAPSWPVIRAIATTSDAVMGGQRGAGA